LPEREAADLGDVERRRDGLPLLVVLAFYAVLFSVGALWLFTKAAKG